LFTFLPFLPLKARMLFLPFYLFTFLPLKAFLPLNFSNWGNFSFQLGK